MHPSSALQNAWPPVATTTTPPSRPSQQLTAPHAPHAQHRQSYKTQGNCPSPASTATLDTVGGQFPLQTAPWSCAKTLRHPQAPPSSKGKIAGGRTMIVLPSANFFLGAQQHTSRHSSRTAHCSFSYLHTS